MTTPAPVPPKPALSSIQQMTLPKMASDMRFIGLIQIIFGAIYCLSIIGAVVGVPLIFVGIRLRESAENYQAYLIGRTPNLLDSALERQGRAFAIFKILAIVGIVMMVLMFIVYFLVIVFYVMSATR